MNLTIFTEDLEKFNFPSQEGSKKGARPKTPSFFFTKKCRFLVTLIIIIVSTEFKLFILGSEVHRVDP